MINETKKQVLTSIDGFTMLFCESKKISGNTFDIAKQISISRSLASQYLNELYKEGELIKIATHPTYFLRKLIIENKFSIKLKYSLYSSVEEIIDEIGNKAFVSGSFISAIGHDLSLSQIISKCQSAVKYPPHGLPMMLYGEEGVGKKFISKLVYNYAINEKLIKNVEKPIYVGITGDDSVDIPLLFGEKGTINSGVINDAKDNFLVINESDKLSQNCLNRIVDLLSANNYYSNSNSTVKKNNARFIFISNKTSEEQISQSLLRNIPIICKVPSLADRSEDEKEDFIIHFLKKEQSKINKKIYISHKSLNALVNISYKNNIDGLKTCIKTTCANAYLYNDVSDCIKILYHHLPIEYTSAYNNVDIEDEIQLFDINEYSSKKSNYLLIGLFNYILDSHKEYINNNYDLKQLISNWTNCMNDYYDFLMFKKKESSLLINAYENIVNESFKQITGKYNMYIPTNCSYVIAKMLIFISQSYSIVNNWQKENHEKIDLVIDTLKQIFPTEYAIAIDVSKTIKGKLEINISDINIIFLTINLRFYNKENYKKKDACIVVCHGYSTASSIADAANKLLGSHVIHSVDMPLETNENDIVAEIKKFLKFNTACKDVIIMVDMGSLENIANQLSDISDVNIGVISNVSTKTALAVGSYVKQGMHVIDILEKVCNEVKTTSAYFEKVEKQKAIVFTSETGDIATERVISLLRSSFPKPVNINIVSCEYNSLLANLDNDPIFKKYDVLVVIGGVNIPLKDYLFIPLENIVDFSETDQLSEKLEDYFTESEIKKFKQNLIKNFSLENLMNNLTILNADMLISNITDALNRLQQKTLVYLTGKQTIAMYIHISCLIERIVINPKQEFKNNEDLSIDEKQFIDDFNESFINVYKHYGIKIPNNEITYLYRYGFIKKSSK